MEEVHVAREGETDRALAREKAQHVLQTHSYAYLTSFFLRK